MDEVVRKNEQKEDLERCKPYLIFWSSSLWILLFMGYVGFFIFHKDISARNFVEDLGGVEKISAMSSDEVTSQIEKFFPKLRARVEYASWLLRKGRNITGVKYVFTRSASGEWKDCEKSLYKNLKNFLMANVFFDGQKKPVEVACFRGKFLLKNK